MIIFRAALKTVNFEFEAYGDTEGSAFGALLGGFRQHCREYGHKVTYESFAARFADDITVKAFEMGRAYRDNEELKN